MADLEKLAEELSSLTVIEAADLSKMLGRFRSSARCSRRGGCWWR